MNSSPILTDDLLTAYLKRPYKAYRMLRGDAGDGDFVSIHIGKVQSARGDEARFEALE
jgi:hypothetical protein